MEKWDWVLIKKSLEIDYVVVFLHTGGVPGFFAEGQVETLQE